MIKIQEKLQKWRVKLGHLFALAIIIFAEPKKEHLIAGTILAIAGEALRIYSAGIINKDQTLSRRGPYAYTRNPLYLGSFLMSLGFCVGAANYYVIVAFLIFFFTVYYSTILREEAFLRDKFGEEYEKFCRETPRFFPRPIPVRGAGKAEFSWAQAMKNKEHEGLAATAVIMAVLWLMAALDFNIFKIAGGG